MNNQRIVAPAPINELVPVSVKFNTIFNITPKLTKNPVIIGLLLIPIPIKVNKINIPKKAIFEP